MAIGGAPKAWRAGAGSATAFTVADLTPAAMLSPVLQPPEIQYPVLVELPPFLQNYRTTGATLSGRAVGGCAGRGTPRKSRGRRLMRTDISSVQD